MADLNVLLAAVLSDPEDALPRLALADLLDETGGDGGWLRSPGYVQFEMPPLCGQVYGVWWHSPPNVLRIGHIPSPPRCDGSPRSNGCYQSAAGWYFSGWRCLHCASMFAHRTGIGIWEWVRDGKRPAEGVCRG